MDTQTLITVLGVNLYGDEACASVLVDCPSLDAFECYVQLLRTSYPTDVVGERKVYYGVQRDWACVALLAAFAALDAMVNEYFDGLRDKPPFEDSALTRAICEAVTVEALVEEKCTIWREDCRFGDGFDPCGLLVAPGSYLNHGSCSVAASGEIRDGRGYHPAATFRWEPSRGPRPRRRRVAAVLDRPARGVDGAAADLAFAVLGPAHR